MGGKNGNKKHGRNKQYCQAYRLEGRYEKAKARKLGKHLFYQPDDPLAKKVWDALPEQAKKDGKRVQEALKTNAEVRANG